MISFSSASPSFLLACGLAYQEEEKRTRASQVPHEEK
jgi:hypothetical protein